MNKLQLKLKQIENEILEPDETEIPEEEFISQADLKRRRIIEARACAKNKRRKLKK